MAFYPFTDSRESQQTFTGKLVDHYENGQLAGETVYIDGLKNGLSRTWSYNGQLIKESNWSDGLSAELLQILRPD